jgi:hypothetical protein
MGSGLRSAVHGTSARTTRPLVAGDRHDLDADLPAAAAFRVAEYVGPSSLATVITSSWEPGPIYRPRLPVDGFTLTMHMLPLAVKAP